MRFLALLLALALPLHADSLSDALQKALDNAKRPPLSAKGDDLYQEKDYEGAAAAYLEHVTHRPDDGNAWYNLACCLSLAGHKDDAVRALEQAIRAGFTDFDHMKGDTDLDPLRKKKSFKDLMNSSSSAVGPKPKTIWVEGGALLPCQVVKPKKYSSKKEYGLILLLHGRGDSAANFLTNVAGWRGDDFLVAALETPYVLGTMNGRTGYCWSPWQSGPGNIEKGYEISARSIGQALEKLKSEYKLDPKRVFLLGFSEGAFMSAHTAMKSADDIAGYICIGGGLDQRLVQPGEMEKLRGKRILIAHGVHDNVVPFRSGKALSDALETAGVQHDFLPYDGAHTIPEAVREAVSGWVRGEEIPEGLKQEEPE